MCDMSMNTISGLKIEEKVVILEKKETLEDTLAGFNSYEEWNAKKLSQVCLNIRLTASLKCYRYFPKKVV